MGNTTLTEAWDSWVGKREQDPIDCLLGVSSGQDVNTVRAVFRTQTGQRIEGNIYQLRSLEYAMVLPHRLVKGQMEVYDFGGMSEVQYDRYLQVCDGIDIINSRCLAISKKQDFPQQKPDELTGPRAIACQEIERIRRQGPKP